MEDIPRWRSYAPTPKPPGQGIIAKIGRFFRGRPKPKPADVPTAARGHRGMAAGDVKKRNEAEQKVREWFEGGQRGPKPEGPFTAEEIAKWETIPADETEAFLRGMQPIFVHSTNVAMAQYYPDVNKMMVEFLGGGAYMYSNVMPNEAKEFVQANSKGSWVWDRLRIRGTKNGHRKPYVRIR